MTTALLVGFAVVVVITVVVLAVRRRSRTEPVPLRRDAPTIEADASPAPRLGTRLGGLFRRAVDDDFWDALEEALIAADVGLATSAAVVAHARAAQPADPEGARNAVRTELLRVFQDADRSLGLSDDLAVIVVVGVNGSGKTTTIAKLAHRMIGAGRSVLVGAADTFRAAAVDQIAAWGERVGFDVVGGGEGADPASVAYDARAAAVARGRDVVIIDTAGRLHSQRNLMDELAKMIRVLSRDGEVSEILLVLDGSTGQNGIAQARAFTEAVGVSGIVIAKLDGSAKGGVAVAVEGDLGIPVKLIGVGESPGDLLDFDPESFVDELLGAE